MWEIWANQLLPQALKSCPKSNKSPNLVTLEMTYLERAIESDDDAAHRVLPIISSNLKYD